MTHADHIHTLSLENKLATSSSTDDNDLLKPKKTVRYIVVDDIMCCICVYHCVMSFKTYNIITLLIILQYGWALIQ